MNDNLSLNQMQNEFNNNYSILESTINKITENRKNNRPSKMNALTDRAEKTIKIIQSLISTMQKEYTISPVNLQIEYKNIIKEDIKLYNDLKKEYEIQKTMIENLIRYSTNLQQTAFNNRQAKKSIFSTFGNINMNNINNKISRKNVNEFGDISNYIGYESNANIESGFFGNNKTTVGLNTLNNNKSINNDNKENLNLNTNNNTTNINNFTINIYNNSDINQTSGQKPTLNKAITFGGDNNYFINNASAVSLLSNSKIDNPDNNLFRHSTNSTSSFKSDITRDSNKYNNVNYNQMRDSFKLNKQEILDSAAQEAFSNTKNFIITMECDLKQKPLLFVQNDFDYEEISKIKKCKFFFQKYPPNNKILLFILIFLILIFFALLFWL